MPTVVAKVRGLKRTGSRDYGSYTYGEGTYGGVASAATLDAGFATNSRLLTRVAKPRARVVAAVPPAGGTAP